MTDWSGLLKLTEHGDNMNTKVQQMIDASMVEHQFQMRVDYETLVKQTVGETILAILATDHRHAMFTTFDRAAIDGATARIVDSVTKHWNFK